MASNRFSPTAFGQADLSNCEREQIHLAGSIQPHGALLVLDEPDFTIVQASANAAVMLGIEGDLLGRDLSELSGDLAMRITPHVNVPLLHTLPLAVRCHVGQPPAPFDVVLHRLLQGGVVVELQRAEPVVDRTGLVQEALQRILAAFNLRTLCDEAARIFRDLTGYDRVMVYRFDEAGHGEVFSEERDAALEALIGNRYPASDIPQIARRLYERNRIRVLVDVDYTPVPVAPALSPISGQALDMSMCALRSASPIHVQYLKNMGVRATLVVSLMVGGKLWGLVSCHHYAAREVPVETRMACELLAEAVAIRVAALESFVRGQAEMAVRRLEQRLIEAIPREGDWRTALFDSPPSLMQPLGATGAALLFEGQVLVAGDVPATQDVRDIGLWLDGRARVPGPIEVIATASLGLDQGTFAPITAVASGLVAVPLSSASGEYLMWFRPERVRTVTWGGDPNKPAVIGSTPMDLSPRRSFAKWQEVVEGTSDPWTDADLTAARMIGDTVRDVILQFRSVAMLIAQDQLDRVRGRVSVSEMPVVVADAAGRVLLTNDSFQALVGAAHPIPGRLSELGLLFADPAEFKRRLSDLCDRKLTWRGPVIWASGSRPMLMRADPVFSEPGRISGYVLLLTDMTEHKAAEAARRQFQERILDGGRLARGETGLDLGGSDVVFQSLLAVVMENAQLAALEITDGADTSRMPEMLESVRASVTRTRRMLEHLASHAKSAADETARGETSR